MWALWAGRELGGPENWPLPMYAYTHPSICSGLTGGSPSAGTAAGNIKFLAPLSSGAKNYYRYVLQVAGSSFEHTFREHEEAVGWLDYRMNREQEMGISTKGPGRQETRMLVGLLFFSPKEGTYIFSTTPVPSATPLLSHLGPSKELGMRR